MADAEAPAWARALLNACLRTWPAPDREVHGRAAVDTALELLANIPADRRFWTEAVGEAMGIVAGGATRWRNRLSAGTREWTMGWTADLRFALRTLGRTPGFTSAAVVTLALGIGANATVFSLVDSVLLRSPPYERPDDLVLVWGSLPGSSERVPVAGPDAAALVGRARTLADVAFTTRGTDGSMESERGDVARHVRVASVTHDFFDVLGVSPRLGRGFLPGDGALGGPDGPAAPMAVMLTDGLWREAFGGDPTVVGRDIRVNGVRVRVAGVMPPTFTLLLPPDAGVSTDVDLWMPLQVPLSEFHRVDGRLLDRDSDNTGAVVARLAPHAGLEAAREEVARIAADLGRELPTYAAAGLSFDVRRLQEDATAHARPLLLALLAGVSLMLLVACLNVATLSLARAMGRAREFAVRAALGGGRRRLLRQVLVESAALAGMGLLAALAVAAGGTVLLARLVPPSVAPAGGLSLDLRTMAVMAALACSTVLLFGLLPGLHQVARESRSAFGVGIVRGAAERGRARSVLVALQVGLSVVLMLGAGLFLRTVSALEDVRPGFETHGALSFSISMRAPDRYRSPGRRAEVMQAIARRISELPGAQAVGLAGLLPLGGDRWTRPYGLPGQARAQWDENRADLQMVNSTYFEAMGTRVLEGRVFTAHEDLHEDERVVVVDEKLAARIAPDRSALDAVIGIPLDGAPVSARVVGVVEHVRHDRLEADGREAIYVPYRQEASRDVSFVVRTSGDPADLVPAVRRTVQAVDPQIPVYELRTLRDYVNREVAPRRFAFSVLLGFAILALVCSAVGLYGVVAYDVSRRTREIGVRMAVGAARGTVVRSVLLAGLRLAAVGLVGGAVLGAGVAHALKGLVFGVGPADPVTWASVTGLVALVTLAASGLPALRASRVSPTVALRID